MAQHFLLSKAARTLNLTKVARMSDDEAWSTFKAIRWAATDGEAFCPRCGCLKHSFIATRKLFKCAGCRHQYSVTSGTIFASRKLPIRDHLLAIAIFANGAKGHSALQLSRDLDCQYRTAFVMAHKLREAVAAEAADVTLAGNVEVDGAYFGGHVRPENMKADRRDRRFAENQTGKRRVVVVIRETKGKAVAFAFRSEAESVPTIVERVAPGSVVHADEAKGWDRLHASFQTRRINHQEGYSADGACMIGPHEVVRG
ncbi:IS1595 family transposase [Methylobacterium sp. Leaf100]|uniref:IS1595 family transposase n=1 Tax=Methylobacterium sp. Leaf100 TaxID=1736252 RepID=UPI000AE84761|nr:IS1595 family transposase [Methylobacterium sp. Leaf100]